MEILFPFLPHTHFHEFSELCPFCLWWDSTVSLECVLLVYEPVSEGLVENLWQLLHSKLLVLAQYLAPIILRPVIILNIGRGQKRVQGPLDVHILSEVEAASPTSFVLPCLGILQCPLTWSRDNWRCLNVSNLGNHQPSLSDQSVLKVCVFELWTFGD